MSSQQVTILIFLTCVGGCIGSFLNVVVYRWPRGKSVVRPNSRCPQCDHAIRAVHNIPVFGWLLLRGKCRDCGGAISGRYAIVEALIAAIFLGLAFHVFDDALTTHVVKDDGISTTIASLGSVSGMSDPMRWALYACQVLLLTSLVGAYLIHRDGFKIPRTLWVAVAIGGVGAGILSVVNHLPLVT